MKKIPTAFKRVFENNKIVGILPEFTSEECKEAFEKGTPTLKMDGSACAVIGGMLYKRYDCKKGKNPPENAILCQDKPDEITGHFPCWIPCSRDNPADKWFFVAYDNYWNFNKIEDGTYEAIGKHFNGNKYDMIEDTLYKHGSQVIEFGFRTFDSVKKYLETYKIEGIVFWYDNKPVCKIKRSDFGFDW